MNTLSSLLKFIGNRLKGQAEAETSAYATSLARKSCTGNIEGGVAFFKAKSGLISMNGRVIISNFARTGSNPGISFTLPDIVPTPTVTKGMGVGFRSQDVRETAIFSVFAGSRTAYLETTETFSNAANGTLSFVFSSVVIV